MLRTLITFFRHKSEIEEIIAKRQVMNGINEKLLRLTHLKLCVKHQQESNRSRYTEHNCDYCNALKGKIRTVDKL